jgi:YYY domain-containing protein
VVDALTWLLAIELLGLLAFPLAFVLFQRLPDRGFTLAKPLALVIFSYTLWVAGLTHLIPNTRFTIIVILLLGAAASGLVFRATADRVKVFLREEWRTLLVAEAVFLAFFLLWLGIASEAPAISHTEKPMDFGFMNAVLQSRFFPPEDPWLAGHSISYYYFGHFMMAFLAKLTAVPSSVAYNLAVSLVPALVGIASFGLVYNLVRLSRGSRAAALGFGLLAPALVLLIGNLEGALEFVHAQGWGGDGFWQWAGIKGLEGGTASSGAFPDQTWWWWRATRVIDTLADGQSLDYTITEFPMFSFLLGDLHPHVMSLPFVVLGLSLGLNLFMSPGKLGPGWLRRHPLESLAIALFVGSLAFINTWDLPLVAGFLVVLVLVKSYGDHRGGLLRGAFNGAAVLAPVLIVAVVLFLPFYLTLSSQASGVLPLRDVSTRPFLFFMTMGLFSVLAVSFVLRQLPGLTRPQQDDAPAASLVLVVALAPLVIWGVIVLFLTFADDGAAAAIEKVGGRALWVLPGLAIVSVAAFSAAQRARLGREPAAAFTLLLLAMAFYLLVGAELFYVVDSFGGGLRRMNTVFKVYYQAWLLLALAGAYGLYFWRSHRLGAGLDPDGNVGPGRWAFRLGDYAWMAAIAVLLAASSYYPVGAVLDRTGVLNRGHTFENNTLDGLRFIQAGNPGEYAAIRWLRDEATWGRIVEAVGDDYSDYGRISASTGLPTVLGWKGHELQWRGSSQPFEGREEDVAQIYESDNAEEVLRLLEWYDVRYVYLGRREQANYGGAHLAGFDSFLKTTFQQDNVTIYELIDGAGQRGSTDNNQS